MRFLENLDLSENSLSIVSEAIFRKRTEQQINVELWQNPLVCDCRLRGFASWVEKVVAKCKCVCASFFTFLFVDKRHKAKLANTSATQSFWSINALSLSVLFLSGAVP